METIIRNLLRIGLVSIYPIVLMLLFAIILHKKRYQQALKNKWKQLLINTIIITIISTTVIMLFFYFEDMIYSYDYSGHWVRFLELRELFFESPKDILSLVYNSMNYNDYSYLPALFMLPFSIFGVGYGYFCLSIFIYFLLPFVVFSQIIYYGNFDKFDYLPAFIYIAFYPLYYGIFFNEVDCVGLIFILFTIIILFTQSIDEIDIFDIIGVNLSVFTLLFLRRYYLYYVFSMYLVFLIKTILQIKHSNTNYRIIILKTIATGFIALLVILVLFMPYVVGVLSNNFSEAYAVYDRDNKISALINYFSILTLCVSIFGIYKAYNRKTLSFVLQIVATIIITCLLFWRVQAFEYHHYNLISVQFLILFTYGIYNLSKDKQYISFAFIFLLTFQTTNIFLNFVPKSFPILTTQRKQPEIFWGLEKFKDLNTYLSELTAGDGISVYLASGSSIFNDDLLRNANLPDLSKRPSIDSAIFDLRDGFPKDLEHIRYVLTIDPIQYINKDYQHMYDVISNAIWNKPTISDIYTLIYTDKISGLTINIYEKTGDYTPEIKQYFYDEMIIHYPDKIEEFKYILE